MSAQWIYTGIILVLVGALVWSISAYAVDNLYARRGALSLGIGIFAAGIAALLIGVWS